MEKIGTRLFKIIFNSNIGNINEKRAEALSKIFAEKFEVRILQEQGLAKVFILANPSRREVILIEPNTLSYQIESDSVIAPDFSQFSEYLRTIYEVLLLDDISTGLIHIVGQVHSKGQNAMGESINIFANEEISKQIPNLKGVGIRYITEHETGLWEYKVEPFINNPTLYYIEMICNISTPLNIIDIIGVSDGAFQDFTVGKKGVLECLGIS